MKHIIARFAILLALSLFASACSRKAENAVDNGTPQIAVDASKPHFEFVAADLVVPAEIGTNYAPSGSNVTIFVSVRLSDAKADELRKFTQAHLNQQIQISVGSIVVAEPFVASEIPDGHCNFTFSTIKKAQFVEHLLNGK